MTQENKDDQLSVAKEMYMAHKSRKEIMEVTGLPESTIKYHAKIHWYPERVSSQSDLLEHINYKNQKSILNIGKYSLEIIERTIKNLANSTDDVSIETISNISKIMTNILKVVPASTGNQESESENSSFSEEEIKEILRSDSFNSSNLAILGEKLETKK